VHSRLIIAVFNCSFRVSVLESAADFNADCEDNEKCLTLCLDPSLSKLVVIFFEQDPSLDVCLILSWNGMTLSYGLRS
jgi:hypothetical protein